MRSLQGEDGTPRSRLVTVSAEVTDCVSFFSWISSEKNRDVDSRIRGSSVKIRTLRAPDGDPESFHRGGSKAAHLRQKRSSVWFMTPLRRGQVSLWCALAERSPQHRSGLAGKA